MLAALLGERAYDNADVDIYCDHPTDETEILQFYRRLSLLNAFLKQHHFYLPLDKNGKRVTIEESLDLVDGRVQREREIFFSEHGNQTLVSNFYQCHEHYDTTHLVGKLHPRK